MPCSPALKTCGLAVSAQTVPNALAPPHSSAGVLPPPPTAAIHLVQPFRHRFHHCQIEARSWALHKRLVACAPPGELLDLVCLTPPPPLPTAQPGAATALFQFHLIQSGSLESLLGNLRDPKIQYHHSAGNAPDRQSNTTVHQFAAR